MSLVAQLLKLKCNNCDREFSLIAGLMKADINLPKEETDRKNLERVQTLLDDLKAHHEECTEGVVVVSGLGYVD
ncbi:MAG: hypothetical protein M1514_00135 [Patescibacteria group bacterium]|nr:hypothetical protein [Patescibacteria group bacterium]